MKFKPTLKSFIFFLSRPSDSEVIVVTAALITLLSLFPIVISFDADELLPDE